MSEKIYDEEIAPKLLEVAKLCKEHQLPLIATVEYETGKFGSTFAAMSLDGKTSIAMVMNYICVMAKGNLDKLYMNLMKYCHQHNINTGESMVVRQIEFAGKLSSDS